MASKIQHFRAFCVFMIGFSLPLNKGVIAAPFPGTGDSILGKPQGGLFYISRGFLLSSVGTGWLIDSDELPEKPDQVSQQILSDALYRHPKYSKAKFNVNVESLKAPISLQGYTKKWIREYHHYGFELLRTRRFQLNGDVGAVYDLKVRQKPIQLRQVLFIKDTTVVTLTCSDELKSFILSSTECDRFIRNFRWSKN